MLLVLLAIGLLASAYVGLRRVKHEHDARLVEIVMDDADFSDLAKSYNYDQGQFLVALRRAGLTSLAVAEELGGAVSSSANGAVYSGSALLDQARMAPLSDPLFAKLAQQFESCVYGLNLVKGDLDEMQHPITRQVKEIVM